MDKYGYIKKEYSIAQLSYLAGIIDGEGSIYIGNFSCNPKTKVPYFHTNIGVTNTDKDLISWIHETFGGNKREYTPKQTPKNSRKKVYSWVASGNRVTHLCEILMPYLICKKRQAEIMLKMRATFIPTVAKGTQGILPLSEEVLALRLQLMNEIRALHTRNHTHKNHGHLPLVAMPQLLDEV